MVWGDNSKWFGDVAPMSGEITPMLWGNNSNKWFWIGSCLLHGRVFQGFPLDSAHFLLGPAGQDAPPATPNLRPTSHCSLYVGHVLHPACAFVYIHWPMTTLPGYSCKLAVSHWELSSPRKGFPQRFPDDITSCSDTPAKVHHPRPRPPRGNISPTHYCTVYIKGRQPTRSLVCDSRAPTVTHTHTDTQLLYILWYMIIANNIFSLPRDALLRSSWNELFWLQSRPEL